MDSWEGRVEERVILKEDEVNDIPRIYPSNRHETPN